MNPSPSVAPPAPRPKWPLARPANPFVLPQQADVSLAVRTQLAREYIRRELPMTWSAQSAALLVMLIGYSMGQAWIVGIGAVRFLLDGLSRLAMQRFGAGLDAGADLDGLIRRRRALYALIGFVWAAIAWPALLLPLTHLNQVILGVTAFISMVIMATSVCFVPPLFTATVVGFAVGLFPLGVMRGGVPAIVILASWPVFQYLVWDLARSTLGRMTDMLTMQFERDRALAEQQEVIHALDVARRQATEAAATDSLTGLPNRQAFLDMLDELTATHDRPFTLMLLDLDFFKNINDTLGHHAGDAVLVGTARTLRGAAQGQRLRHFAARLGGDEFAVVLHGALAPQRVEQAHARWLGELGAQVLPGYGALTSSVTAGSARWPQDALDRRSLLNAADMALRRAKATCRGTHQAFEPGMTDVFIRETQIANLLLQALDERGFVMHLQPQVRMRDGHVVAAEALTRFTDAQLATFPVQMVFDVAEERGLGPRLSAALLDVAVETVVGMDGRVARRVPVAINLSPSTLKSPDRLLEQLQQWISSGLEPAQVKLEITEDAISARGLEHIRRTMDQIAAMGFQLALDDFGTGHSALSHLHTLPIHEIKIAKQFVERIVEDRKDQAIVKSALAMCEHLGIRCVVEGVEDAAQAARLTEFGATLAQGHRWHQSMPVEEFVRLMQQQSTAAAPVG